mgnify:CR=1 FL=1
MKESIESILAIDQKTKELNIQTKKALDDLLASYRKEIAGLEFEQSRLAKEKALEEYNKTLESFDREIEASRVKQRDRLEAMDLAYERVKEDLVTACYKDLIEGSWEDHE